jgi:hypothetical protein
MLSFSGVSSAAKGLEPGNGRGAVGTARQGFDLQPSMTKRASAGTFSTTSASSIVHERDKYWSPVTRGWPEIVRPTKKAGPRLYDRGLANGEGRVSISRTLSASWSAVNGLAIKACPATPDTA